MKVSTAERRWRGSKGAILRTRGSDTYDHHGRRKALRDLDRALIEEQLEEEPKLSAEAALQMMEWKAEVETYAELGELADYHE
jgi:hypothetical protein